MAQETIYYATGKRKNAIAKTWITPGNGEITINGRSLEDYFRVYTAKTIISQPLLLTNNQDKFDIKVKVLGGGVMGQAGAIRHGITKALIEFDADLRSALKKSRVCSTRSPDERAQKVRSEGCTRTLPVFQALIFHSLLFKREPALSRFPFFFWRGKNKRPWKKGLQKDRRAAYDGREFWRS